MMFVKLLRLKLEPRHDLGSEVGGFEPGVLVGQDELPKEAYDDEQQNERARRRASDGAIWQTSL